MATFLMATDALDAKTDLTGNPGNVIQERQTTERALGHDFRSSSCKDINTMLCFWQHVRQQQQRILSPIFETQMTKFNGRK